MEDEDLKGPVATRQIYDAVAATLGREKDTYINRASSANLCVRRRWYQRNGYEGERLTPRQILNFAAGDIGEHVVKYFIQIGCVGAAKLYSEVYFGEERGTIEIQNHDIVVYEQETLIAYLDGIEVTAHADGWGRRNSDGKWELIEVKTASDYGFRDFINQGPENYLKQAHVCMVSDRASELGVDSVRFFYMKKSTGHIWDSLHEFDEDIHNQNLVEYRQAISDEIPDRPFEPVEETYRRKPTGRSVLPWQCSYCPYTATCWPKAEKQFKSNNKPIWVIGVKK